MYGCERWTVKKAEHEELMLSNFDAEEDFWESLASKEIKPVKISLEYSFEGLWLKWKLQYFGHLMWRANSLVRTLMLGKIESQRRRGQQRLKMVEWHHWLNGHAFEQTPIDSEGQVKGCCWIMRIHRDSWPPEEKNSIRGQRRGLIAQSFCVIKFY